MRPSSATDSICTVRARPRTSEDASEGPALKVGRGTVSI